MKANGFLSLVVAAAFLLPGGVAVAGRHPIPHPGPPTPQRAVAEEWVRYIASGNQRNACLLQAVAEVAGRSCEELPTRQVLRCPKNAVIHQPSPRALLKPYEQVGAITEEGADRGYAVLKSQRKTSRWRGAIGLERSAGTWRVSYLRQANQTYSPAGLVWMSEVWRRLWYPPTCSQ